MARKHKYTLLLDDKEYTSMKSAAHALGLALSQYLRLLHHKNITPVVGRSSDGRYRGR